VGALAVEVEGGDGKSHIEVADGTNRVANSPVSLRWLLNASIKVANQTQQYRA
jgi:hypothetical protein